MPIKSKDAHKMLIANGWQHIKGGKGSHRKYTKDNETIILAWHGGGKDLKPYQEKQIKLALK